MQPPIELKILWSNMKDKVLHRCSQINYQYYHKCKWQNICLEYQYLKWIKNSMIRKRVKIILKNIAIVYLNTKILYISTFKCRGEKIEQNYLTFDVETPRAKKCRLIFRLRLVLYRLLNPICTHMVEGEWGVSWWLLGPVEQVRRGKWPIWYPIEECWRPEAPLPSAHAS